MPMDQAYKQAVESLRLEGRLTDYRAGELKCSYTLRRRFFGIGAFLTLLTWLALITITWSWIIITLGTIVLGILLFYFLERTTKLEYAIARVSNKTSDDTDKFLNDFLAPFPELHRLFRVWRSQGHLWRHDEVRLIEIAQYARLEEKLQK